MPARTAPIDARAHHESQPSWELVLTRLELPSRLSTGGSHLMQRACSTGSACREFADEERIALIRALRRSTTGNQTDSAPLSIAFWMHSIHVACAAAEISRSTAVANPSAAFVCGLTSDLGRLVLRKSFSRAYERVHRILRGSGDICDAEHRVFGLDHATVGKFTLESLRLPDLVVRCAWLHHQPAGDLAHSFDQSNLLAVTRAAEAFVRHKGWSDLPCVDAQELDESSEALSLKPSDMESLSAQITHQAEQLQSLAGIDSVPLGHTDGSRQFPPKSCAIDDDLSRRNAFVSMRPKVAASAAVSQMMTSLARRQPLELAFSRAARSLQRKFHVGQLAIVVANSAQDCLHIGVAAMDGTTQARVFDTRTLDADTIDPWRSYNPSWMSKAPDWLTLLWNQLGDEFRSTTPRACALRHDARLVGVILVSDHSDSNRLAALTHYEQTTFSRPLADALAAIACRRESELIGHQILVQSRMGQRHRQEEVRSRSMATVAVMAAGAAHELNTPLAVISGRAQMELSRSDDPDRRKALQTIIEQAHRTSDIVTELMDIAKPPPPVPAAIMVNDLLKSLCQRWQARANLREDQFVLSFLDPHLKVFADANHLDSILDALLSNAADAVSPATACLKINSPSRASDETVRIEVSDNGVGMDRYVLEHAVDPFFSYRPAGRGRGLGLSRANRLATINGGSLRLESTPGVGTTATLELPALLQDHASTACR